MRSLGAKLYQVLYFEKTMACDISFWSSLAQLRQWKIKKLVLDSIAKDMGFISNLRGRSNIILHFFYFWGQYLPNCTCLNIGLLYLSRGETKNGFLFPSNDPLSNQGGFVYQTLSRKG